MFIACREEIITDVGYPKYIRAYAWWKNLQAWATLRYSDHQGLLPSSLRLAEGTLRGQLLRTKTTGPDKKIGSRAFVVSAACYLQDPSWLSVGFALWSEFLTERSYVLCLPTADLSATISLEASYADASAMSRALLSRLNSQQLRLCASQPLLLKEALGYWTEYSGRHDIPSWVASLMNVPDDWVSSLGGWAQKGTAPKYIETSERRIMTMQQTVAESLRSRRGTDDTIDEDKIWHSLEGYLLKKGVGVEACAQQMARLHWFRGGDERARASPLASAKSTPPLELLKEPSAGLVQPDLLEKRFAENLPTEFLGKYAISIGGKSGYRRLHLLGACFRVPCIHYVDYELHDLRPDVSEYNDFCRQCWRPEGERPAEPDAVSDSSSSDGDASN